MASSSSSPARHLFLFALAFLSAGAADAWPAWGNGRMFFSKATRPEAVELDKVAVATPDATNSNRASDEFSRPSSGGSHNRGYGLYGRPEESYPEAYFRRGVHHDAEKLTTTSAAAATAEQEKEEEAAPAGDDDAWLGYPADGSGRGRPRPYARGQQQQTTTNAAAATAEQEDAPPARVAGDGAGLGYPEDGSGRGRPMSYARMRGGQQQPQQQYDYGMSDTRLYQNGRYYYDVNTGKYGYGRESNPVRTRPEEFNGGRKYGGNAAGGQEYANGNYQEEFGIGHRAGEQVRRYGNGNVAGQEYANGNDHEEFGIGHRAGVQTGRRYDNAAAGYYDANGQYIP